MEEAISKINRTKSPRKLLMLSELIKQRLQTLLGHDSNTEPVGHYGEWLTVKVRTKLGFVCKTADSSTQAGYDLEDSELGKIQVKSRVERKGIPKTYIRDLEFNYLIYIVFSEDFKVKRVFGMSVKTFQKVATKVEHENSQPKWLFRSTEEVFNEEGVDDLTNAFSKVESKG